MRNYGIKPCRHCGNPVTGYYDAKDVTMYCSRAKCGKIEDNGSFTNKSKASTVKSDKAFKRQLNLDSRGY